MSQYNVTSWHIMSHIINYIFKLEQALLCVIQRATVVDYLFGHIREAIEQFLKLINGKSQQVQSTLS